MTARHRRCSAAGGFGEAGRVSERVRVGSVMARGVGDVGFRKGEGVLGRWWQVQGCWELRRVMSGDSMFGCV